MQELSSQSSRNRDIPLAPIYPHTHSLAGSVHLLSNAGNTMKSRAGDTTDPDCSHCIPKVRTPMFEGILHSLKELISPGSRSSGTIFLASDLHLNHARILRHCHRPFSSLRHMNRDLVQRWNQVVGPVDTVYHLGDFSIRGSPDQWIRELNGRKVFIRGNHDRDLRGAKHHSTLSYGGYEFYLVHDPRDAPPSWKGWVIHGHTHNKVPQYPFINGDTRTINVSCECTGYAPLSIDRLLSLDLESISRMETVHSQPVRKNGAA